MSQPASPPALTLSEAAALVGGRLEGDPSRVVVGLAPVASAGPSDLAFLAARGYVRQARSSRAGAFLVAAELERWVGDAPRIVVEEPHRALVLLLRRFEAVETGTSGVHPTAVVGRGVRMGVDVSVGPYAVLEEGAEVGDGSRIGAHAVVGRGARIGRACTLHPHVVVYPRTILGDRVIVHSGSVLGADGFGYAFFDGAHQRIPHGGRAVLGDDVEIGANAAVDRGSLGDTVVEQGVKIDNLVQVAHNVQVGAHSMLAGMVGVAGSTRIGKGVLMGGQSGAVNHLELGDGSRVAAGTKVFRSVPPGETVSGHPARPHREELRRQAWLGRVPALAARVEELEARIESLLGGGALGPASGVASGAAPSSAGEGPKG